MILTALCCIPFVQAQDIITTKDGKDIQSKILEVNANEVKYKKYNNLDGPTFTLSKSEILIVRYENGENEVFQEHNNSVDKKYNTTAEVVVGMRYREYKICIILRNMCHSVMTLTAVPGRESLHLSFLVWGKE